MIYFTSDLHFYHQNVIKYDERPFNSIEDMNEGLILNWNNIVGPEDTTYILGDFSLAFRPVETIPNRLNGKKFLVPGNHDFCHSYNKKSKKSEEHRQKWIGKYCDNGLIVLPEHWSIIIGNKEVLMTHMPYDNIDPRYIKYIPENNGKWLLHGHTHSKEKIRGKMINVACTAWDYKPVSIIQIEDLMRENLRS